MALNIFVIFLLLSLTALPHLSSGQGSGQAVILQPNPTTVPQSFTVVNSTSTPSLQVIFLSVPAFALDGPVVLDYLVQNPRGNVRILRAR